MMIAAHLDSCRSPDFNGPLINAYHLTFTAWEGALLGSSPGDSIQSYSGSSSPPLSDDGNVSSSSTSSTDQKYVIKQNLHKIQINQHIVMVHHARRGQRTTSLSTSDEGIVMDYGEEMPRKRRVSRSPLNHHNLLLAAVMNGHTHRADNDYSTQPFSISRLLNWVASD